MTVIYLIKYKTLDIKDCLAWLLCFPPYVHARTIEICDVACDVESVMSECDVSVYILSCNTHQKVLVHRSMYNPDFPDVRAIAKNPWSITFLA